MRSRAVVWTEEWADELLPVHWSRFRKMFWMGVLYATVLGLAVLGSYLLYSGVAGLARAVRLTAGPWVYTPMIWVQLLYRLPGRKPNGAALVCGTGINGFDFRTTL